MSEWFSCSVRYDKRVENGLAKRVTETYLVEAVSYTEAEARFIDRTSPFMTGEWAVSDIKKAHFREVFDKGDGDRYYAVKVNIVTLDERSGAEKRSPARSLVKASDLKEAIKAFEEGMRGTIADHEMVSVSETKILDIYPYDDRPEGTA